MEVSERGIGAWKKSGETGQSVRDGAGVRREGLRERSGTEGRQKWEW